MTMLRMLLYGLLGAAAAAVAAYILFLRMLVANGADPALVPLFTLLSEVMGLERFAILGAVLGVLLAPFAPRQRYSPWWALWWLPVGVAAGLLAPFAEATFALGGLPTAAELPALLRFDWTYLAAGASAAFTLSAVEISFGLLTRGRARREGPRPGEFRDVDGVLREFWEERANNYLAQRQSTRHPTEGQSGG